MPDSIQFNSAAGRSVPDCIRFSLIHKELEAMLVRQESLPMDVADHHFCNLLTDILEKIDAYINYEPSDSEMGYGSEPPLSANERWNEAHKEHLELHS
jgi:hypothetical protein